MYGARPRLVSSPAPPVAVGAGVALLFCDVRELGSCLAIFPFTAYLVVFHIHPLRAVFGATIERAVFWRHITVGICPISGCTKRAFLGFRLFSGQHGYLVCPERTRTLRGWGLWSCGVSHRPLAYTHCAPVVEGSWFMSGARPGIEPVNSGRFMRATLLGTASPAQSLPGGPCSRQVRGEVHAFSQYSQGTNGFPFIPST